MVSDEQADALPADLIAAFAGGRALNRLMLPDDLVGVIVFLLSDAARFMTGQTLSVDGGRVLR